MKKFFSLLFMLFLFALMFLFTDSAFADERYEVTVQARGASQEEALSNAIDDAIRRSTGALVTERSQLDGDMLEERLTQFSRGLVSNYEILESSTDEAGVVLTVRVTVNAEQLQENVRVIKEGTSAGGIGHRQIPNLEAGQSAFAAFLKNLRYESFLDVGLEDKQADVRRGVLNVTVSLSFNRERYFSEFAEPVAAALSGIFASSELRKEIEEEYEKPEDRFTAFFNVLGENFSSHSWMLPRVFYDVLERNARFWNAGRGRVQTHRRLWLHFSLLDASGREIERLPVHLKASNVLFFSEERAESANPWFFMGVEPKPAGLRSSFTLTAAPKFGVVDPGKGYAFFDNFRQAFAFNLPESLLTRVNDVRVALELER
ncbi:MAG: hypothetical protein FWG71_05535 [Synergistaceae bacterium]|nr:hypothetical protein [Synergistaceae bacterium]